MPKLPPTKTCLACGKEYVPNIGGQMRCNPCGFDRAHLTNTAASRVQQAIKCGKLIRQPCEICGATKAHAHHDDYSKPLDVRWLCRRHHMQFHAAEYRQQTETTTMKTLLLTLAILAGLAVAADARPRTCTTSCMGSYCTTTCY